MKLLVLSLPILLGVTPVFAQEQVDDSPLRGTGAFGVYALGNLALQDYQRGNDPVEQMKTFFIEAKQPLSSAQIDQLSSVVEDQVKAIQGSEQDEASMRRLNLAYNKKISDALTPDQRLTLRRYRTKQIMMRGGFPALKRILEDAQVPFTADQEAQAQTLYRDFYQQANQLTNDTKRAPEQAQLYKLANQSLAEVVRLLTPEQRRALAASRQGTLIAKVRP